MDLELEREILQELLGEILAFASSIPAWSVRIRGDPAAGAPERKKTAHVVDLVDLIRPHALGACRGHKPKGPKSMMNTKDTMRGYGRLPGNDRTGGRFQLGRKPLAN